MIDVLLPSTDAGVALQFGLVLTVGAVGFVIARRDRDVRLLVIGLTILLVALMGLRAIH